MERRTGDEWFQYLATVTDEEQKLIDDIFEHKSMFDDMCLEKKAKILLLKISFQKN